MRILSLLITIVILTGCTGAVSDFVDGGGSRQNDPIPPIDLESSKSFKLSPGSVISTSSTVDMRATITPTSHQMISSVANVQMSLHATPTK